MLQRGSLVIARFSLFTFLLLSLSSGITYAAYGTWTENGVEGDFEYASWNDSNSDSGSNLSQSNVSLDGSYEISNGESGHFYTESDAKADVDSYCLQTYGSARAESYGGAYSYGYSMADAGFYDTYTVTSGNNVTLGININLSGSSFVDNSGGYASASVEFGIGESRYGNEMYKVGHSVEGMSSDSTWSHTDTFLLEGLNTGDEITLYYTLFTEIESEADYGYSEAWYNFSEHGANIEYFVTDGDIYATSGYASVPIPGTVLLLASGLVTMLGMKRNRSNRQ